VHVLLFVLVWLSRARCRFVYGSANTTVTHCLLLQEIQIGFGFTFLVSAHLGSPGQNPESRKMVVVVVVVTVRVDFFCCRLRNMSQLVN